MSELEVLLTQTEKLKNDMKIQINIQYNFFET